MVAPQVKLPTRAQCEALWEEYHTPAHIRRHCTQVAQVALFLSQHLERAGIEVNVELCERAALLHDLVRVTEWKELRFDTFFDEPPSPQDIAAWEKQRKKWPPYVPHAQVNAEILREHYPQLAAVVASHSVGAVYSLSTWEEKIVHYADRRVAHDKIVTVEERFADFGVRYPNLDPKGEALAATKKLENEIYSVLSLDVGKIVVSHV